MELSDFKTFDPRSIKGFDPQSLKKFSFEDFKALIMPRKWEALAVLFAVVGAIVASQLYSFNSKRISELDARLVLLQAKEDPITQLNKTMKEAGDLFASLPKGLNDATFIPAVTEIAKKFGIRISDFAPPTFQEFPYHTVTSSQIAISTSDFKSLLKFIRALESAEYAMRVKTLNIAFSPSVTYGARKSKQALNEGMYSVSLSLSSIMVTAKPPQQGNNE